MNKRSPLSYENVAAVVRAEVAKARIDPFTDQTDLIRGKDRIAGDDLSFMAIDIEKKLGIKVPRSGYDYVMNVETWTRALLAAAEDPPGSPP